MRICWDIETNGLDPDVVWVLVITDMDKDITYVCSDHDDNALSIKEGVSILERAKLHVGHNLIGFDLPVMEKLHNLKLADDAQVHDTWIMSQLNSYKRNHRHGMGAWGEVLGHAKIDFNEWDAYTQEMRKYCINDVKVNIKIYQHLVNEVKQILKNKPEYKKALKLEHDFALINKDITAKGWLFDMPRAEVYLKQMEDQMSDIEKRVEPKLPMITLMIDKEPKPPRYTANGNYHATTAKHLSEHLGRKVFPSDALADEPPIKPDETYQRTEEVQATLGNLDSVKQHLLDQGWEPDDWNMKKVTQYEWAKTTPKLTSTSLEPLGQLGKDIDTYYTVRNRHSVLRGWIDAVKEGRLRGRMWCIGTPTFRVRHEVITNIPAVGTLWGKEMRSLLIAEEGYKVVGADSAGNQMRGLCHYVDDAEFTNEVINGDVHQRNADVLECSRGVAKGFLYAFLFGAGDKKLGSVLTGAPNSSAGKQARDKFASSIPGLKAIRQRLDKLFHKTKHATGNAFFPGLDGRRIYVESSHQALNYLLQAAEGVTCKAAMVYAHEKCKEEGIDFYPALFYHDEMAFIVREDQADRALAIMIEAFEEAPKAYGVMCMGGDGTIGNNYADVH